MKQCDSCFVLYWFSLPNSFELCHHVQRREYSAKFEPRTLQKI